MNIGTLNIEMTANLARFRADMEAAGQVVTSRSKQMVDAMFGVVDSVDKSNLAGQRLINALKYEADTFGMTREQLTMYKASMLGVGDEAQKLIDRINRMREAQLGFAEDTNVAVSSVKGISEEVKAAGGHMEGFNLSTAGARRELLVLAHEASQGNWKNFGGSLLVLAERTDFLKVALSGTGVAVGIAAAAIGTFAYAAISGWKESAELSRQLNLTGNYAGITAGQFNQMAASIAAASNSGIGTAKEALQGFVSSGKFTADTIGSVTKAAVEFAHQSGESTEDVIADFQKMTDGVTKWAEDHNKQYHFLSAAEYDQIRTLDEQGKATQAIQVTMEALDAHLQSNTKNLGLLESGWNAVKNAMSAFWDAAKSVGRQSTTDDVIAQAQKRIEFINKEAAAAMDAASKKAYANAIADQQAVIDTANETKRIEQRAALRKSENDQRQAAAIQAMDADKKLKDSLMSRSEQEKKAVEDYLAGQERIKAANSSLADSDAKVAEIKAAIHEKYKVQNAEAVSQYQHLVAAIKDKIVAQELQNSIDDKMTEGEKIAIKFKTDLENGTIKLTDAEKKHVDVLKATVQAMTDKLTQDELAYRAKQDAIQQAKDLVAAGDKMLTDMDTQIEKQRDFNDAMGLSKDQVDKLKAQKQLDSAASDEQLASNMRVAAEVAGPLHDAYIQYANDLDLAAAKKRTLAGLQTEAAEKQKLIDAAAEAQKQADKYQAAWDRSNKSIGDGLYSALSTGGDNAVKKLIKDLKEWFARLVLQPVIAPIAAFGASLINPLAANAQGTLGGALGGNSTLSMLGAGKSLWDGFSAAMGTAGSLGTGFMGSLVGGLTGNAGMAAGLQSGLGLTIGNNLASVLGPQLSSALASGISGLAAAAPWVAAAMAVYTIGKSAFGMGDKQITGSNVSGTIGTDNLQRNVNWTQQGGWLRSDRSGTWSYNLGNSTAIADGVAYQDTASVSSDKALLKALTDGYSQLKTASVDYAKALGIDASSIASRTDAISFAIGKDATETQNNIAKMFSDLGDKIASDLLGPFSKLAAAGETASATLTRLAAETQTVDTVVSNLNLTFAKTNADGSAKSNLDMVSAKDNLINASGGMTNFSSQATFFAQNFFTAAEQIQPAIDSVNKGLAALGITGVSTTEQFKKLVQGLDLSTDAGAKEYAALMALAPAFKQVADYNDQLAQALASTNANIQQQIDALKMSMMSEDEQRAAQLQGVDASTAALLRNYFALQDQKKALDAASAAASALASTNSNIQQQIDTLKNSQLTLNEQRQKQLDAANDDSTKALLRQLFAEQDKVQAAQDAAAAEQAAQQAAIQAAQQAAAATQQLTSAWQSVTDSIFTEVNRIRGLSAGASVTSYADAQAQFAITNAQAQAGDMNAAKLLPQLSQALLTLAEQNASSAADLAFIRAQTANALAATGTSYQKYGVTIPQFAAGGDHAGGVRLVGENGPELEVTGPSRIYNASQTKDMLSGGADTVTEIRALRDEVAALRRDNSVQNTAIATHTERVARFVNRNEFPGVGLLVTTSIPT